MPFLIGNRKSLIVNRKNKKMNPDERYTMNNKPAFTLIELLIVIAILGILAAAVMVAINPAKRLAQARDAQRKSDVNAIANALIGYYTIRGSYPLETRCDTSRGSSSNVFLPCNSAVSGQTWSPTHPLYIGIIQNEGFLKQIPVDPKNDTTYYYRYEGFSSTDPQCLIGAIPTPCASYWIGARLEGVDNPSKQGKMVFRCSDADAAWIVGSAGCKVVELKTPDFTFDENSNEFEGMEECLPTDPSPCN